MKLSLVAALLLSECSAVSLNTELSKHHKHHQYEYVQFVEAPEDTDDEELQTAENDKEAMTDYQNVGLEENGNELIQLNNMNELKFKAEMLVESHAQEVKDINTKVAELERLITD